MKCLSQFMSFDIEKFLEEKTLVCTGCQPWFEYGEDSKKTDKVLGTDIQVAITVDNTQYKQREGSVVTNLYQTFSIKVPKNITVPVSAVVEPVNPSGTVWGDFKNNLSVKADDVKVAGQQTAPQTSTQAVKPSLQRKEM